MQKKLGSFSGKTIPSKKGKREVTGPFSNEKGKLGPLSRKRGNLSLFFTQGDGDCGFTKHVKGRQLVVLHDLIPFPGGGGGNFFV